MENLNKNANYTYEEDNELFIMKGSKDVTEEKVGGIGVKAREALGKVLQDEHGNYRVEFAKGYTQYGRNYRLARRNAEIGFVLMGAKEEKEALEKNEVRDMDYYMKSFKKNGIHTNGKDIPTFIDLEEDYKKAQEKKAEKEAKKAEKAKETKETKQKETK